MSTVSIRYMIEDVPAAITFYTTHLGFTLDLDASPAFASVSRDGVKRLREAGLKFRNEIVKGPGGFQILLDDPSGNPVELFQPQDLARITV